LKTTERYSSGTICVPAGVDEQGRVPGRQEAWRCRRVGRGKRGTGQVEQFLAVLVPEPPQLHAFESRLDVADREHGPVGDVRLRRRPERGQVAADEQREPFLAGDVLIADPVLGRRVKVGAPLLPGSGGRHPDEVEVDADTACPLAPEELLDLLPAAWTVGEKPAYAPGRRRHIVRLVRVDSLPPAPARVANRDGERPVIALGDQVDRRAHQRRLDDRPALERAGQRVTLQALHARPEPEVHRRRVLRLKAGNSLERSRNGQPRPIEQQLPGQQRAVQLPPA